jgi:serine/threonine protein phosphatase PrpC
MGTYLSTPVTEKHSEEGESWECCDAHKKAIWHVAWGVVDMQGWRKSMEDAHVTQTNVPSICIPEEQEEDDNTVNETPVAHVFGVFDGHGGPEVARFCALYIVSVLQQQIQQLMDSSTKKSNVNEQMGSALKNTFHALDRLIDDPSCTDELMKLRVLAPSRAEQRVANFIPPPLPLLPIPETISPTPPEETMTNPAPNVDAVPRGDISGNVDEPTESPLTTVDSPTVQSTAKTTETPSTEGSDEAKGSNNDVDDEEDTDSLENPKEGLEEACMLDQDMSNDDEDELSEHEARVDILPVLTPTSSSEHPEDPALDSNDTMGDDHAFMTSIHVAMNEADTENPTTTVTSTTTTTTVKSTSSVNKVAGMLQRLLKFNGSSGQLVLQLGSSHSGKVAPTTKMTQSSTTIIQKSDTVVTFSPPSVVRNGQLMCNLSDHHIHAGATAIVAVMVGRTLTVANAGDSRAVLARGAYGVMALSLDHKPSQPTELRRIVQAGGFVNSFGRINGNLNLSRSIGDLKYKQVKHLPPAQQMITAEPDIVQLRL